MTEIVLPIRYNRSRPIPKESEGRTLVIYLDVLLTVNLTADYFLLLLTARFLRSPPHRWRLILAGGWGAVASLAIFLPTSLNWLCLPGTIFFAASMIGIAFGRQPWSRFFRALLVFLGSNALFTGTMTLMWYFVAPRGLLVRNNVVYYDCSPWMLLGLLAVSYTVLRVGEGWLRRRRSPREPRIFRLSTELGEVSLHGMVDTGNLLTEAFSGLPVVIVPFDRVKNLLPTSLWNLYGGDLTDLHPLDALPHWKKHFRLLPVASVSGKGVLPSFRGRVTEKNGCVREVCVAVCREPLGEGEIDALLPENL